MIDKMHPEGEEDFLKFEQALKDKITTYEVIKLLGYLSLYSIEYISKRKL